MNPATNSGKGTLSINMDLLAPSAEEESELKAQQEEPPVKEPEFLPCQLVRIKQAAELEAPDIPFPAEHVQGMAGVVEMAGKVQGICLQRDQRGHVRPGIFPPSRWRWARPDRRKLAGRQLFPFSQAAESPIRIPYPHFFCHHM